jgi:YggT family protein
LSLYNIINIMFTVYVYLIIVQVILSWVPHNPSQSIFRFIDEATEPILAFCRRLIPPVGGIDFSPMIAILAVELVRRVVLSIIASLF